MGADWQISRSSKGFILHKVVGASYHCTSCYREATINVWYEMTDAMQWEKISHRRGRLTKPMMVGDETTFLSSTAEKYYLLTEKCYGYKSSFMPSSPPRVNKVLLY